MDKFNGDFHAPTKKHTALCCVLAAITNPFLFVVVSVGSFTPFSPPVHVFPYPALPFLCLAFVLGSGNLSPQ